MTGNVTWIGDPGSETASPGEPVESLVEELEEILERARSGEIRGMCIVTIDQANEAEYWIAGQKIMAWSILGGIEVMKSCLLRRYEEHDDLTTIKS